MKTHSINHKDVQTNLVIDRGNSYTKIALFCEREFVLSESHSDDTLLDAVGELLRDHEPKHCVLASVREEPTGLLDLLEKKTLFFRPTVHSALPILLDYASLDTLGMDRIADAVGGWYVMGGKNCLVIDCGTCITYNVVQDHAFRGGAISPGLVMRYQALHQFTDRLPLVAMGRTPETIGKTTTESMVLGVQQGTILEVEAMSLKICSENAISNVLLTGGDIGFFEKAMKTPTFAHPRLTLIGLNEILLHHIK